MTYEAWRCTYQSSEQAARAAYERTQELEAQLSQPHPLHQHLLHMLGASSHEEAGGIIAKLHACELAAEHQLKMPEGLHPRTADLVARFATALAEKLHASEVKRGYSDGWASPDWLDECRAELVRHVAKGDPRDVAAYCAFLWHHGAKTELAAAQQGVQPESEAIAEIVSASHDNAEFGERAVNFLRDFNHLEYGTKLYAHPTTQGLDAPTLDGAWKARLLDGRELERDEYGFGFHPELPEFEESTDVCKFFEAIGVEIQCTSADEDLDCEEYDRMSGTDPEGPFNFTDWKPSTPDGEGWKLVSIHDTEDGPYAMWLRQIDAAQAKQGEQP